MVLKSHKISVPDSLFFMKRHKLEYMCYGNEIRPSYFNHSDNYGFYDTENHLKGLLILEERKGFWEPHIVFMKDVRGVTAIKSCKNWMKSHIKEYKLLKGRTPLKFRGALQFSKWMGFKSLYEDNGYLISELRYE